MIVIIIISIIFIFKPKKNKNKDLNVLTVKKENALKKSENSLFEEYKVDIKGEINSPGIYSLKSDSRVIDVIEKAGGLTENADTSVINLSLKIKDEMVIIIYSKDQVRDFELTKEKEKNLQEKCNMPDENSLKNDACIETSGNTTNNEEVSKSGKVSLNTASLEELMNLPGIGEAKAKDIINYRESNGEFKTVEDIMKVSGIGESTFAQIKEIITV